MRKWRECRLAALLGIAVLVAPVPAASGKSIIVANCGGGMMRIDIPADPTKPDGHECCRKGCHAANDRRKKGENPVSGCC